MANDEVSQPQEGDQGQVGGPQVPLLGQIENDKVSQPQEGDQGQVGGPQVPLLGHGSEIRSPNWACRDYRT